MTGRIEILATAEKAGLITTNTGASTFHYAYQLPRGEKDGLTVGGLVTFEPEKGNPYLAISVCPKDEAKSSALSEKRRQEVRYQGFEQTQGVRTFKFRAWRTGEENQEAVVTVDLALLRKHGITIQEGPGICLRLLEAELPEPSLSQSGIWKHTVTDQELMEHLATRRSSGKRRA